ncbi:uncharacterized protein LOC121734772 [Aricia agestis]|uniref:uncharacterized protein LOC121734772 n=1 Tax=Aricia agestis TaxID=91739 RepID=UPI001C20A07E|nr:uncharacterized protein LOC121734772 [Aricia agestis]
MAGAAILAVVILAGATVSSAQLRDYRLQNLDLIRILTQKPWHRYDEELHPRYTEDEDSRIYSDDFVKAGSDKRSAVATALNGGRRRRQPAPALGVLNDVGTFFDSLRDNLETLASLSPQQRSTLFQDPPSVVQTTYTGGSGGGSGIRKLHALRPLRPTGNIRSYNRRSDVEAYGYPGANHHDPGLLWTGLGR